MKLNKSWTIFVVILTVLTALALYKSELSYHYRNLMEGFVLIVIAMIFIKRVQKGA